MPSGPVAFEISKDARGSKTSEKRCAAARHLHLLEMLDVRYMINNFIILINNNNVV